MVNQLKSKSLNLQETVSKNPEKIPSDEEINIKGFLKELARNRKERINIMQFVMELGAARNRRLGVK